MKDAQWITIKGNHVLINNNGTIIKGPKNLIGTNAKQINKNTQVSKSSTGIKSADNSASKSAMNPIKDDSKEYKIELAPGETLKSKYGVTKPIIEKYGERYAFLTPKERHRFRSNIYNGRSVEECYYLIDNPKSKNHSTLPHKDSIEKFGERYAELTPEERKRISYHVRSGKTLEEAYQYIDTPNFKPHKDSIEKYGKEFYDLTLNGRAKLRNKVEHGYSLEEAYKLLDSPLSKDNKHVHFKSIEKYGKQYASLTLEEREKFRSFIRNGKSIDYAYERINNPQLFGVSKKSLDRYGKRYGELSKRERANFTSNIYRGLSIDEAYALVDKSRKKKKKK